MNLFPFSVPGHHPFLVSLWLYTLQALTTQLKEAESLLASTVYQAKQKLENISQGKVVLSFL